MASLHSKKYLTQVEDCFGHLWNVVESRPTEHMWPVLFGYPVAMCGGKGRKGGAKIIITPELRDYLEAFRMHRAAIRLPLSQNAIHRLRNDLGMNYVRDRKQWWQKTKGDLLPTDAPLPLSSLPDDDCLTPHKTWKKDELRLLVEFVEEGKEVKEVARLLGKSERSVDNLRRRLFGVRKPQHAWPEQDKETLLRLRQEGCSAKEIAAALGRDMKAVQKKISVLAPRPDRQCHTWAETEKEQLRELVTAGLSVEELMETMGRSRNAIIFMRRRVAGVRYRKLTPQTGRHYQTWTEEERQQLKELALAGCSTKELMEIMGRSRNAIVFMRRQLLSGRE